MGFHETLFPTDISYGSRGGPGFSTAILETDSGSEERIARWTGARRSYDVAYAVKEHVDLADLRTFYIARRGPADGFRFKDFQDSTSSADGVDSSIGGTAITNLDVQIGTGDNSTTQFQLIKKYTEGPVTRTRNITKPVAGTVLIALDGVAQTIAVDFTVNTITGIITFTVAPGLNVVITAGYEFDVPVRFSKEVDEVFSASIEDFAEGSISVPLVEIRDEGEVPDEFCYRGAKDFGAISANISITVLTGLVINVDPQSGGLKVILPDETTLPSGGEYFLITNDSGANTISIRDSADVEVVSLGINSTVSLYIADVAGTNDWFVFS